MDEKKRKDQISRISHQALRDLLEADHARSPTNFILWLQESVRAGLSQATLSNHPSDQARQRLLEQFASCPVERFFSETDELSQDIPAVIGIRCLSAGVAAGFNITRCDRKERVFQHFKSDPGLRCVYVGYCMKKGLLDRAKPILLRVNQVYAVTRQTSQGDQAIDVPADSPLQVALGSRGEFKRFLAEWQAVLDEYCTRLGIVKRFTITQGCVIVKCDGSRFQFRNFMRDGAWMKGSPFRNIRHVYRSPLRAILADPGRGGAVNRPEADE